MKVARLYRVSALVIRQRNLGEADRILTLLTRERGKLSAVAKGVKRPRSKLAAGLQLFSHASVQLAAGRSLEIITQVQPVSLFYHLREDLGRYAHASYISELADGLTEEQHTDPSVFELLLATLTALDSGGDPATLVRGFELKLLTHLGYGPELDACVVCGLEIEGGEVGFSAAEGGVVCRRCVGARGAGPLAPPALRAMRDLLAAAPGQLVGRRLTSAVASQLERVMRAYVDYRVERPLQSAGLLPRYAPRADPSRGR